jgi:hypothetical protein
MYKNLSDGKSNGIVLLYMQEGVLYPVALSEEQANALDLTISIPFHEKGVRVVKQSLNVKNGIIE